MAIETKTSTIAPTGKQGPKDITEFVQGAYASIGKTIEKEQGQVTTMLAEFLYEQYDRPSDAAEASKMDFLWSFLADLDTQFRVPLRKRIEQIGQLKLTGHSEKDKSCETNVLPRQTTGPLADQTRATSPHEHGEGRAAKPEAPPRPVALPRAAGAAANARRKLDRELKTFESMRRDLLTRYEGLFVAVHLGQVIDADADDFRLARRVEHIAVREGPVAICRVYDQALEPCAPYPFAHFESPELVEG